MKLRIAVDGKAYEVEVDVLEDDEAHARPRPLAPVASAPLPPAGDGAPAAFSPGGAAATPRDAADEQKVCRSPIAGIVVRVIAQVGQELRVDDPLLVLEAMKMESSITSPVAARVKRILVEKGASVQKGQVLVEFE